MHEEWMMERGEMGGGWCRRPACQRSKGDQRSSHSTV